MENVVFSDEKLNETSERRYVVEGKSISLECALFGFPEPNYTWRIEKTDGKSGEMDSYNNCAGLKTCIGGFWIFVSEIAVYQKL